MACRAVRWAPEGAASRSERQPPSLTAPPSHGTPFPRVTKEKRKRWRRRARTMRELTWPYSCRSVSSCLSLSASATMAAFSCCSPINPSLACAPTASLPPPSLGAFSLSPDPPTNKLPSLPRPPNKRSPPHLIISCLCLSSCMVPLPSPPSLSRPPLPSSSSPCITASSATEFGFTLCSLFFSASICRPPGLRSTPVSTGMAASSTAAAPALPPLCPSAPLSSPCLPPLCHLACLSSHSLVRCLASTACTASLLASAPGASSSSS